MIHNDRQYQDYKEELQLFTETLDKMVAKIEALDPHIADLFDNIIESLIKDLRTDIKFLTTELEVYERNI